MPKCRFVFTEPGGGWHSDKDTHAIKPGCMFDVVEDITAFELFRDYIALRRPVLVRLTKPSISTSNSATSTFLSTQQETTDANGNVNVITNKQTNTDTKPLSKEELAQKKAQQTNKQAWSRSTIAKVHVGIHFSTHVVPSVHLLHSLKCVHL
jgi:hypothetical protein